MIYMDSIPESDRKRLESEVNLLSSLKHKYILRLYKFWYTQNPYVLVMIMEKIKSGSLTEYIKKYLVL